MGGSWPKRGLWSEPGLEARPGRPTAPWVGGHGRTEQRTSSEAKTHRSPSALTCQTEPALPPLTPPDPQRASRCTGCPGAEPFHILYPLNHLVAAVRARVPSPLAPDLHGEGQSQDPRGGAGAAADPTSPPRP